MRTSKNLTPTRRTSRRMRRAIQLGQKRPEFLGTFPFNRQQISSRYQWLASRLTERLPAEAVRLEARQIVPAPQLGRVVRLPHDARVVPLHPAPVVSNLDPLQPVVLLHRNRKTKMPANSYSTLLHKLCQALSKRTRKFSSFQAQFQRQFYVGHSWVWRRILQRPE